MARTDLAAVTPDGRLRLHFHPGQLRAWDCDRRFVVVLAGTQSGKTSYGPYWLYREIKLRGPGDYLACSPTYPLMSKKMLPEFLSLFKRRMGLGDYNVQQKLFTFSAVGQARLHGAASETPTRVYFGHAQDPESLESATYKGAWADEAGQNKFRLGSWEAVLRRLSIHQGRVLVSTTPYNLGWLKQKLYDPWDQARRRGAAHPEIEVVSFDSTSNPAFPKAEFERARQSLPRWKFDMFYRARFTRPAGLIYDSFDPSRHAVPRFRVPAHWPRYAGIDFGGTNTAAVFLAAETSAALEPTGRLFAYREYRPGKRDPREHVSAILGGEPQIPACAGGSASEDEWRARFAACGLPVAKPPVRDVEVGIDAVYALCARGELLVMEDLAGLLDELASYSRELDEAGEPTRKIEAKDTYHLLDALRYAVTWLRRDAIMGWSAADFSPRARSAVSQAPPGVFLE